MNSRIVYVVTALAVTVQMTAASVDMMIGARGMGFGGAYVALVNDPSAAYWNPAALSRVADISVMESNWIFQDMASDLNVNYATCAFPIPYVGTVSGSWLLQHAVLESGYESAPNTVVYSKKNAGLNTFSLSIGRALWKDLWIFSNTSLGFSINREWFTSDGTADERADGMGLGFDLGLHTQLPLGFTFGLVGRNLASDMMGLANDPELRFGIGYENLINDRHKISLEADGLWEQNRDYTNNGDEALNNMKWFGGLEYALVFPDWEIALRGGGNGILYNSRNSYGYSAGLGVRFQGYALQYAFTGANDPTVTLGYQHRIDLVIDLSRLVLPQGVKK
jgi:hypothetical protein